MAMGMGSILGMMGSVPVTKSQDVIINKLKAAKTLEAGDTSGLMNKNMLSGLQGMLKPPSSKGGNQATDAAREASQKLSGSPGQDTKDMIDTNLVPKIGEVVAAGAELVGIGSDPQALISVVGASNTLSTLSKADPANYGLQVLLGPALADEVLFVIASEVLRIAADVSQGLMTDAEGVGAVTYLISILTQIIQRSEDLRTFADTQAVYLASVSAISGLLSGGPLEWQTVMQRALYEDALAEVEAANIEFTRID